MNKIYSLSDIYKEQISHVTNFSIYYFNSKTKLIPYIDYFIYYFYIIENKIYINDFEFKNSLNYITLNENINTLEYKGVFKYDTFNNIYIDKGIIIKNNYTNAGHSFGNITHIIYSIINNIKDINEYNIVITEELYKNNKFLCSIIYQFFDKDKIIILNDNTIIHIKNTYIVKDYSYIYDNSKNFILNRLKLNNLSSTNNKENIFLIKSSNTQNVTGGYFNIEYNNFLKQKGFEEIIPENYDIVELFNIINNAKNVIMSWGCCSYLNSIFVGDKSNILVISHIRYSHEYNEVKNNYPGGLYKSRWFPDICNKKIFLEDLTSELTSDNIIRLENSIYDLLK